MDTELIENCYLCLGRGEDLYSGLEDRVFGVEGDWNLRKCGNCRIVWLVNRPKEEFIYQAYRSYYTHSVNDTGLGKFRDRVQSWYLSSLFRLKKELIGSGGRLLDVGCGSGQFLKLAQSWGWTVEGIEPDPTSRKVAEEKYRLKVWSYLPLEERSNHFDVVTMFHVLEHLYNPITSLEQSRELLRPGGKLMLLTPNTESLGHRIFGKDWRGLEPPRHLYLFSSKSLRRIAQDSGFQVLKLGTSARLATNIFAASSLIGKGRYRREDIGLKELVIGVMSHLYEEQLLWTFQPGCGEELVLIGRR